MANIKTNQLYDCVVIGGGPAGISAAIYLARFNRSVAVIDCETGGRWNTHEKNENFFGFPNGIPAKQLRELGKEQAKQFGTPFIKGDAKQVSKNGKYFTVSYNDKQIRCKTIILANGVTDQFPQFEHMASYVGRSLFWCIACDGHKTINKRVIVRGYTTEAMVTALQFLNFTKNVTFVTDHEPELIKLDATLLKQFQKHNVSFLDAKLISITGESGIMESVEVSTGEKLKTDFLFSVQEATPNSTMAKALNVTTDANGYIITDIEQRTSEQGIYAAGDITKAYAHQIASAVHEGATAAQAVNYDLYEAWQKE